MKLPPDGIIVVYSHYKNKRIKIIFLSRLLSEERAADAGRDVMILKYRLNFCKKQQKNWQIMRQIVKKLIIL